jgi:DNA-binding transcriptional regulator LsrR (DeoR family)
MGRSKTSVQLGVDRETVTSRLNELKTAGIINISRKRIKREIFLGSHP